MAQQKTESKNQNKRNNETVKHVQLERKRPKLSKVNGSKQGNNKSNNQNKKNNNRRPKQNQTKRDPKATLRIIPLGGLDAIGKNMTVFECKNDMCSTMRVSCSPMMTIRHRPHPARLHLRARERR